MFIFDKASDYEALNLIEHLPELEAEIRQKGVRLVISDLLNSFTKGDQSSDVRARCSLSGPLGSLARRTGACVIGVRNQGRGATRQGERQGREGQSR